MVEYNGNGIELPYRTKSHRCIKCVADRSDVIELEPHWRPGVQFCRPRGIASLR